MKAEAIFPGLSAVRLPYEAVAVGVYQEQCEVVREQGSQFAQLLVSAEGKGVLETEGQTFLLEEGAVFFLPAERKHRYYPANPDRIWRTDWISLAGTSLATTMESLGMENAAVVTGNDVERFERVLKQILTDFKTDRVYGQERASVHVYELLTEFVRLQREVNSAQYRMLHKLLPVLDYIDEHITEAMTLEELAGVLQITPQHLCRTFKECFSMRPFEYVTRRRIQISKRYLADRSIKVAAVGRMVGIRDVSYYCYNFKRFEGITPNEFRNLNF